MRSHLACEFFQSNEGAVGSIISCQSENIFGLNLVEYMCGCGEDLHAFIWYERGNTASNVADAQSRVLLCAAVLVIGADLISMYCKKSCLSWIDYSRTLGRDLMVNPRSCAPLVHNIHLKKVHCALQVHDLMFHLSHNM